MVQHTIVPHSTGTATVHHSSKHRIHHVHHRHRSGTPQLSRQARIQHCVRHRRLGAGLFASQTWTRYTAMQCRTVDQHSEVPCTTVTTVTTVRCWTTEKRGRAVYIADLDQVSRHEGAGGGVPGLEDHRCLVVVHLSRQLLHHTLRLRQLPASSHRTRQGAAGENDS